MKSDDTEIRHIKGRTVKVQRLETTQFDFNNGKGDWHKVHWPVSVLTLQGWQNLITYTYAKPGEMTVDRFEYCFDEAGAVL